MAIAKVALAVAMSWGSLPSGLAVESTCAENDHACKADTETGGVGMLQKGRSLNSAMLEDGAEDSEMDSVFTREMRQAMARDRARVKMRVEQDLSKLSDKHYSPWDSSADCHDNADQSFDNFIDTSNLNEEMSAAEITCFRTFFDEHVVATCKSNTNPTPDEWDELIKEAFEDEKPVLTEAMAASINAAHSGTFSVRVPKCMPTRELKTMEGIISTDEATSAAMLQRGSNHKENTTQPPSTFDPVTTWPECSAVIQRVHNQGTCGSCWAFAGAHALDARVCIASGGLFQEMLSRTVLTSCSSSGDGCNGGMPGWTYDYIGSSNVPTGGADGCMPYFAHGEGIDHFHDSQSEPACPTECLPNSGRDFATDSITAPGAQNGGFAWFSTSNSGMTTFQNLIMQGPVAIAMYVNNEFYGYSSGVFDSGCGTQANHAITAIGWGSASGQTYFDTFNSWGTSWGDNGKVKIAPCVIYWYEYPGDFTAAASGWNFGPTPPPTIPPPTPTPLFTIDGTGCTATEDGCVASLNYPGDYNNDISCTIQNMPRPFTVVDFNTENFFDKVTIGDSVFSGSGIDSQLASGTLTGDIEWLSDFSVVTSGWKICPPTEQTPTANPTASPTANPTANPTASPTANPTANPTASPTANPTATPTANPTANPTAQPTANPTSNPTANPTAESTALPFSPTANPTAETIDPEPTYGDNVFDMIDADGDNLISRAELENAPLA
jgi:hypothetical protein